LGANNGQCQNQPKEGNTRIGQLHMGRCLYHPKKNGNNMMVAHSTHVLENTAAAKEEMHLINDVYAPYLL
jgi:hypothetical protein